jgi:D-alanyl-D-alanine carboxypeptidase
MKKRIYIIIPLIILFIVSSYVILSKNLYEHYNEEVLNNVDNDLKQKLESSEYSKTMEEMILNNKFKDEYYNYYLNITYQDKDNFLDNVNIFLDKGYDANEINHIYNLSELNINKLTKLDYESLFDYWDIINFNANNYERYKTYKKNNTQYELKDVVTYVNVNADLPQYTNTFKVSDSDNILVLVNKFNYLDKAYKPSDLVTISGYYGNVEVRNVVKDNFINLQNNLKNELNIDLEPTTAYRSYSFQKTLYNKYVKSDGIDKADTYSARAGYSEHQTGLAIDLKNPLVNDGRLNEIEYSWLKDNAYKYGFIIRFPEGKEFITRYEEENWHIRYVGNEAAKTIHDNNLTLEEYIDLYETDY